MSSTKSPPFSTADWTAIRRTLAEDPEAYGLPRRVPGSLVLASFNIRKLGGLGKRRAHARDDGVMRFLADVCRHFDLLAVQEVMPETEGVARLRDLMGSEYGLIVSDTTGAMPGGGGGMPERMAFLYNRKVVRRAQLVTDVTYDRSEVLDTLVREFPGIRREIEAYRRALRQTRLNRARGMRARRPTLHMPAFLTFVRTPFAVAFRVRRYEFLAVNAHLIYGNSEEDRQREGGALVRWMIGKARDAAASRMNLVLFGDLNLDFDQPDRDLARISTVVEAENKRRSPQVQMSFPFLFPHPRPRQVWPTAPAVFRSNVGLSQSFDQIGIFTIDARLRVHLATTPEGHRRPDVWGATRAGPDYGVFNFSELFSRALMKKPFAELGRSRAAFVRRFDFRVSDHLPIWYRFPLRKITRTSKRRR